MSGYDWWTAPDDMEPCPHCKSAAGEIGVAHDYYNDDEHNGVRVYYYQAECSLCGRRGPRVVSAVENPEIVPSSRVMAQRLWDEEIKKAREAEQLLSKALADAETEWDLREERSQPGDPLPNTPWVNMLRAWWGMEPLPGVAR